MDCKVCKKVKRSDEFPNSISFTCAHLPSLCLSCCLAAIDEKTPICPQCSQPLTKDDLSLLQSQLNMVEVDFSWTKAKSVDGKITISTIDGRKGDIEVAENELVSSLKKKIQERFEVELDKQRLVYDGKIIQTMTDEGKEATLDVPPGATIQLLILLLAIPERSPIEEIKFELSWGYPDGKMDYLDGTCLLFPSGRGSYTIIDYNHTSAQGITHSGDVMGLTRGAHTINVSLKTLHPQILELIFVLSAWKAATIGAFPNPSVAIYDIKDPTKQLAKVDFTAAGNSQALLMCALRKIGSEWLVHKLGGLSSGNAKNYSSIVTTIRSLSSV